MTKIAMERSTLLLMGNLTIWTGWAIFNGYVTNCQRVNHISPLMRELDTCYGYLKWWAMEAFRAGKVMEDIACIQVVFA